ncbi:MAG: phosphomannomutase [Rickettsiales bacterium]|nr:phosphomannomutase [Rickettsiales bacterium]
MINHSFDDTIIRAYDVRGVYNQTLNDKDAQIIGNLFGLTVGKQKTVNVGYDGRISSLNLKNSLINGLLESGVNVNEVGLGPTPLMYFSCFQTNSDGGIMVTGSHNPKNHNGFKFVLNNLPFYGDQLKEMCLKGKSFSLPDEKGTKKTINLCDEYIKRLIKDLDQKKNIDIVWDAGNGSAGNVMKQISQKIQGKSILLFDKIDGNFPNHHPDPSEPENLRDCINKLKKNKFDIGIAFDGDGDRIGIIDDKGRILSGDKILLIFAYDLLKEQKVSVIGDVKCSQVLFDEVKRMGGNPIMSKTGHSHIKINMKKFSAKLAGEMSGHIFFADKYYGFDDALYAAIRIIDILSNKDESLSQIVDRIPKVFNTPEIRIDCDDKEKFVIVDKISSNLKKSVHSFTKVDGVRVKNSDGWWLLRASNTQPVLVLRCESLTKDGLAKQISFAKKELGKVDKSLCEKF